MLKMTPSKQRVLNVCIVFLQATNFLRGGIEIDFSSYLNLVPGRWVGRMLYLN